MVQPLWFGVSAAYMLLAIAEGYFASQIETIDLPPIKKYAAGTREQLDKFVKEVRGESPAHDALIRQVIIDWSQWLKFNKTVTGIETVAEKFNAGAKANKNFSIWLRYRLSLLLLSHSRKVCRLFSWALTRLSPRDYLPACVAAASIHLPQLLYPSSHFQSYVLYLGSSGFPVLREARLDSTSQ